MKTRGLIGAVIVAGAAVAAAALGYRYFVFEPGADLDYDTRVVNPAFAGQGPRVLFDQAHRNSHSASGRYRPFANLLRSDGCRVQPANSQITDDLLSKADIYVCVNARGPKDDASKPAFTESECDTMERWVKNGGALLLVADHHPCGTAAAALAGKFGVVMTDGWTDDEANARAGSGDPGQLLFARDKGSLGDHAITLGRNESERVSVVETFTGQSLVPPSGAVVLMPLADSAVDRVPVSSTSQTTGTTTTTTFETDDRPAEGHCQGLAMRHGKGRVVVLAEAAMLTAQEQEGRKFGMNAPGNDNRQFTLNTIRWLAGALGE